MTSLSKTESSTAKWMRSYSRISRRSAKAAGTRRPKNPWGATVNVDTNVQELRHDAIVASDAIIVGTAIGDGAVVGVGM